MIWKVLSAVTLAFVTVTSAADAQRHAVAMWRAPISSVEEAARAIERGDTSKLWATPSQILEAVRRAVPASGVENIRGLASYIRTLDVRVCPAGEYVLSRVLMPSRVLDWNFRRRFRAGEQCLFDRNLGRYVMSSDCGNVILDGFVPQARHAEAAAQTASPVTTVPRPPTATPVTRAGPRTPPTFTRVEVSMDRPYQAPVRPIERRSSNWVGPLVAGVVIAVGVTAIVLTKDNGGPQSSPPTGGPVNPPNGGFVVPLPFFSR
ncbi:MAG TPA: hypothetical protein VNK70_00680 [Candidatus Paceibacterota bacterium]|nr:hypothetical protein [Candidatus Paceibacterota bacterium]